MRSLIDWDVPVLLWKDVVHFFREPGIRTIFAIVPLLSAPLLLILALEGGLITRSSMMQSPMRLCLINTKPKSNLDPFVQELSKFKPVSFISPKNLSSSLQDGSLDAILTVVKDRDSGKDSIDVNASNGWTQIRLRYLVDEAETKARSEAMQSKNVKLTDLAPFRVSLQNIDVKATGRIAEEATAMIAMLFCTFCVGGIVTCVLVGEFEHSTIETTLLQPSRRSALTAKGLAATAITLTPVLMTMASFALPVALYYASGMGDASSISLLSIAIFSLSVVTVCVFTAFLNLYFAVLMRGAKVSAIFMNLANIVIDILIVLSIVPLIKLDRFTAIVPVMNICLAAKSVANEHGHYLLCAVSFLEMFALCNLILLATERLFSLEDVVTAASLGLHKLINPRGRK